MLIMSIGAPVAYNFWQSPRICYQNNDTSCLLSSDENRYLKDELEQLRTRSASDARLQQKLQQDLINLEKVNQTSNVTQHCLPGAVKWSELSRVVMQIVLAH